MSVVVVTEKYNSVTEVYIQYNMQQCDNIMLRYKIM
jgi:hypothetical protein